jgi:hypothetical protein
MWKKCADEKQLVQLKFGLPDCQPLALFALCTGASSDPMVCSIILFSAPHLHVTVTLSSDPCSDHWPSQLRVYTAKNIMEELDRAKLEFLQATMVVRKSKKKVFLPRLVERYAREASLGPEDVLPWAQREAGTVAADGRKQQQDAAVQLQRASRSGSRRKAAQAVEWLPYSSRFRYAFARSVVDKPQC